MLNEKAGRAGTLALLCTLVSGICSASDLEWQVGIEGHARTMYESYHGLDFGVGPVDDDDWLHQRVQLMAMLDRGEALRLAAEFTWGRMWGRESALAPPDQDDPDLLQLYVQGKLPLWGGDEVGMK